MKRNIIVLGTIFLLSVILAVITRTNIHDNLSGNDYSSYTITGVQDACEKDQTVTLYIDKLFRRLDPTAVIAKVRFTGTRNTMYESILSVVDVIEVYKGDNIYPGDRIAIYEDARVIRAKNTNYLQVESINLMVPEKEYYVFVNPMNMKNSRTIPYLEYTGECDWISNDMIWFPPYIYPLILNSHDVVVTSKRSLKYSDVQDYPFLANTNKGAKDLLEIYQAVIRRYGLDRGNIGLE